MEDNNLYNAVIIAENIDCAFVVTENDKLHAIDSQLATYHKYQSNQDQILELMRRAFGSLLEYCKGKVPQHHLEISWELLQGFPDEMEELKREMHNLFWHLPHRDRQAISSLAHHTKLSLREREKYFAASLV